MKPHVIVHTSDSLDGPTLPKRWRPECQNPTQNPTVSHQGAAWGAVFALSLCVFVLIASEFLPVSLLTPIAADLAITEGEAGRAISVSGIFAVSTSLLISR